MKKTKKPMRNSKNRDYFKLSTKELQTACTEKQYDFVKLLMSGLCRHDAYVKAGYQAKNKDIAAQNAGALLTRNDKVIALYDALKAEKEAKTNIGKTITRTDQLNALEDAKKLATTLKRPSALVSAIREQNEMLGYHKEKGPNEAKERAKLVVAAHDQELIRGIVANMTKMLAQPGTKRVENTIIEEKKG